MFDVPTPHSPAFVSKVRRGAKERFSYSVDVPIPLRTLFLLFNYSTYLMCALCLDFRRCSVLISLGIEAKEFFSVDIA